MTQETQKPRMARNRTIGDAGVAMLDAVDAITNLKLSAELGALLMDYDRLKASDAVMDKLMMINVARRVREILVLLGSAAIPAEDPPITEPVAAADDEPEGEVSSSPDDELSDDPNSPNYRYADTGYIADSRKELAANSINIARKNGERVRADAIDWAAIEQNPRQAAELVTKANLFGKTDWDRLQAIGMSPAAGFLISKVYGSIGPAPAKDGAIGRKDYAYGLETIRDRLEGLMTVDEGMEVLKDIKDELMGVTLNSDETERSELIRAEWTELADQKAAMDTSSDVVYKAAQEARSNMYAVERDVENRKKRKWPIDNALIATLKTAEEQEKSLWSEFSAIRNDVNPKIDALRKRMSELGKELDVINTGARMRNLLESPATRAWLTFGERFFSLLNYRSSRGSDSFAGHVTNAKVGKIKDWSWADPERATSQPREATKTEINFQMKVADNYVRRGGRQIEVNSTKALKDLIGFREVQSGNWVLKDPNSAKFHVEQTAAAMCDFADLIGVDVKALGLGGRLGMAFGARGKGGKNAPRAHYEPVERVVALTKQGGGGALVHEFGHALDNILHELVNQEVSAKKDEFSSASPDLLPPGPIRDAMKSIRTAILDGSIRAPEVFKFTENDVATAKHNMDVPRGQIARVIKAAGNAVDAVMSVDTFIPATMTHKRSVKQRAQWRRLAAAYYAPEGETSITLKTGPGVSSYRAEATVLDNGTLGKYWSETEELFARALQAWTEDRLAALDRQNDYLSAMADNKFYEDGLFGPMKPFPEGDERIRINAAFDQFFAAIRDEKVFEKVLSNPKLLDDIFGISDSCENVDSDAPIFDSVPTSVSSSQFPIILGSMTGKRIARFNETIEALNEALKSDHIIKARYAALRSELGTDYDITRDATSRKAYLELSREDRPSWFEDVYYAASGFASIKKCLKICEAHADDALAKISIPVFKEGLLLAEILDSLKAKITTTAVVKEVKKVAEAKAKALMPPTKLSALVAQAVEAHRPTLEMQYRTFIADLYERMEVKFGAGLLGAEKDKGWASTFNETLKPLLDASRKINQSALRTKAVEYAHVVSEAMRDRIMSKAGDIENPEIKYLNGYRFVVAGEFEGQKVFVEQSMIVNVSKLGKLFNQYPARITLGGRSVSEVEFKTLQAKSRAT